MKTLAAIVLSALTFLPSVSAHGFVKTLVIDGKSYQGNVPNASPSPSVIRQISTIDPVKGASNPNLNCGQTAQKASLVADAQPGSALQFFWAAGGGQNWPHNTGPVITYMASCGSTTCDKFDSTQAKWFKIDQAGQDSKGVWAQQTLQSGAPFNLTLPSNIAPGQYLMRHEIIALHLAQTVGGAEFYPSCSQVKIGGSGTGVPSSTVSFPGAYSDQDPGIFDPDVYNPGANYTFPGPPLSNFVASNSSSSAQTPSASPPASPSTASSAQASASAGSSKTCKSGQKKRMVKRHISVWSH